MSLDINMKDVKLIRDDDGWVYISKDGIEKTSKLLVDDGETPDVLKNLQTRFDILAKYNDGDAWNKALSNIDWLTTFALSFASGKGLAPLTGPIGEMTKRLVINNMTGSMVDGNGESTKEISGA